jgi:hypothetical protein
MNDAHACDVNDYLKFGFLRALQSTRQGPLVVIWMLTPPPGDFSHLEKPETCRTRDAPLFDRLKEVAERAPGRSVKALQNVLGEDELLPRASFVDEQLPSRAAERSEYFKQAEREVEQAEGDGEGPPALVFLDPDTGLEIKGNSRKHVRWEEVKSLARPARRPERAVVVYQSGGERRPQEEVISERLEQARKELPDHSRLFLRGPRSGFLLAAAANDAEQLRGAATAFADMWPQCLIVSDEGEHA